MNLLTHITLSVTSKCLDYVHGTMGVWTLLEVVEDLNASSICQKSKHWYDHAQPP